MGILAVCGSEAKVGRSEIRSGSKGHTWKPILIHFLFKRFPTFCDSGAQVGLDKIKSGSKLLFKSKFE